MFDKILELIINIPTPGYFVTTECSRESSVMPSGLEDFVVHKHSLIIQGLKTRKFVYQADGWRLILTFFPTTEVVEEKYALKNKVYKHR